MKTNGLIPSLPHRPHQAGQANAHHRLSPSTCNRVYPCQKSPTPTACRGEGSVPLARMPPQMSPDSSPAADFRNVKPLAVRAGLGRHVFGLGIVAIGIACLVWGDFITGQTVPNDFPHRIALAYAVAAFLLCIGLIMQWRRSAPFSAATLAAYYIFIVIIIMNSPGLLAHYKQYGTYEALS